MRDNPVAGFGNDDSNAELYLQTVRRSEHIEPEKALLIALLEDAVQSYRKFSRAGERDGKQQFTEAEEWILSNDRDWIFSFKVHRVIEWVENNAFTALATST